MIKAKIEDWIGLGVKIIFTADGKYVGMLWLDDLEIEKSVLQKYLNDDDYDDSDRYYERKKEEKAIEDAKNGIFYVMKEGIKQ